MIDIHSDIKNLYSFRSLKRGVKNFKSGIRNAFVEVGSENKKHLRALIFNPPKTGKTYNIELFLSSKQAGIIHKTHQASAPGEPPANLTGALMKSVGFKVSGSSSMEFGEGMFYGKDLELGIGVAKRPHLGRTIKEKSKDNYNSFNRIVFNEIRK